MSNIVVLGSFMMDLVARAKRLPNNGETIVGDMFDTNPGGKGANQAATLANLGEDVYFAGMVGHDDFGDQALDVLDNLGVNTSFLFQKELVKTGVGCVWVDENGHNRIIVIPGANLEFSDKELIKIHPIIEEADLLMLQLEMDFSLTKKAIDFAYQKNIPILLNPAPAAALTDDILSKLSYLTPNETELGILVDKELKQKDEIINAAISLIKKGVKNVVVTLGERGSIWVDSDYKTYEMSAYTVRAVDTVAAGDSFNGALAYGIVNKMDKKSILEMANKVGAMTVTKEGAIKALPKLEDLSKLDKLLV